MSGPQYNLSLAQATAEMKKQLAKMRAEPDRSQVQGLSLDEAVERGYEMAIKDLDSLMGQDPKVEFNDAAGRLARGEIHD